MNYEHIVEPSYIIFKEDSKILARNGKTGVIEYSGSDGASVIQSAINALTNGRTWRERILIKGNFSVASKISVPSFTFIEIQGKITRTTDSPIFAVDEHQGEDASSQRVTILGGILDGNGYSSDIIQIYNLKEGLLRDITFQNFKGNGIYLSGQPTAAYKTFYVHLEDLMFGNLPSSGYIDGKAFIYIDQNAIDGHITHCHGSAAGISSGARPIGVYVNGGGGWRIESCHFDRVKNFVRTGNNNLTDLIVERCIFDTCIEHSVYIETPNGRDIRIINNRWINPPSNYDLIYLDCTSTDGIKHLKITGNINRYSSHRYCVNFQPSTYRFYQWEIDHNFWRKGSGDYYNNIPWEGKITDNQYYDGSDYLYDNNSGTATISAGQTYVDVSHSLSFTPSLEKIKLVPLDNLNGRNIWVSDATSSTFRINLSSKDSVDHQIGWSYGE